MDNQTIRKFIIQSLNMGLNINGESSFNNSFDVEVTVEGFYFIPRLPSSFVINTDLYQRIFEIANATLYPNYTLLKQNGAYFVPLDTDNIHIQRGLFFPWKIGIPERLKISDVRNINLVNQNIPLMKDLDIDFNDVTHVAIAGNSGSGKSYHVIYWLYVLKRIADITIIDPKFDSPSRWATLYNVNLVRPQESRSKSDFVTTVNEELSKLVEIIMSRQKVLFNKPSTNFRHKVIVIDELLALTSVTQKQIKDDFFALLSQVALLGRATNVHIIAVSQRFDANTLPTASREQFNILIQLGNINKKTTQFLFPDLDGSDNLVIPKGPGTGLIQVIDGKTDANITPFLTPKFYDWDGVIS